MKDKNISMKNKIYFPMTIRSEEKLLESFKKIIDSPQFCITNKKIQKHPYSAKEKKMLRFEEKLKIY